MNPNTLLKVVIEDLSDLKAHNIHPLDVQPLTPITDFMVIATGNSSRHCQSICDHLVKKMKERSIGPIGVELDPAQEWLLVDLGDVIVHIMQQSTRDFYQLEKLWSHSPSSKPIPA